MELPNIKEQAVSFYFKQYLDNVSVYYKYHFNFSLVTSLNLKNELYKFRIFGKELVLV